MLPAEGMCAAPGVSALKAFKPDRCGWTQEKKEAGSIGENCYLGEKGKGTCMYTVEAVATVENVKRSKLCFFGVFSFVNRER